MLEVPAPPPLEPGQLQIWKADLLAWQGQSALFQDLLSGEEIERYKRYKVQAKRSEFLVSRGLLRLILAGYLNKDPREVELLIGLQGKPSLTESDLNFNISHSGNLLLCACGLFPNIGVDIQEIYGISGLEKIIERYFSPAEKIFIKNMESPSGDSFFELWAAKEALLKAMGAGFQVSPAEISLVPNQRVPGRYIASVPVNQNREWSVMNLEIGDGFKAAVAADGEIATAIHIDLEPENTANKN